MEVGKLGHFMAIGVFPSKNIVEVSTCGEGGEGAYARVYGDGVQD